MTNLTDTKLTNITVANKEAFNALRDPDYSNFALFSCFVDGEPAAAIVAMNKDDSGNTYIEPLFVSITAKMKITNHDGVSPLPNELAGTAIEATATGPRVDL